MKLRRAVVWCTAVLLVACGSATVHAQSAVEVNVALASSGAVATASSTSGVDSASTSTGVYPIAAINDNERAGSGWGSGGGWADGTPNAFPDWVQINFNGTKTIDHVVVYTLQDSYASPVEPTDTMIFTQWGVTDFDVQGWDGSGWITLSTVSGNNLVKRTVTFSPVTTDRIRITVHNALAGSSRITEVEAWGVNVGSTNMALAAVGAVASASSADTAAEYSFAASGAIDNERAVATWGQGSVWKAAAPDSFPDWLEVDFAGSKTIDRVVVYSVQDDYSNLAEPTDEMTFTRFGLTDFAVQGWDGDHWVTLATVAGNDRIKRTVNLSPFTTDRIRIEMTTTPRGYSRITEVEAWGVDSGSTNVAQAALGAVASVSSVRGAAFGPAGLNDNERAGLKWGRGGGWASGTPNAFPDWVQIHFNGTKTVDRIVVYTLQDRYASPVEPTDTMTFTRWGVTDFDVQGWDGSAWVTLGTVSGNNLVKRTVTFSPYTTDQIRINVTNALGGSSRITEIEAWGKAATAATTTTLASSANPSILGAAVTFTATVTGSAPTGTVNFTADSITIAGCNAVALSAKKRAATCSTSALAAGTHSIVARYGGDAANSPSTSPTLSQLVNKATSTTSISSSTNPSTVGASVTFTASVTGAAPTGTVSFTDGGATIGGCGAVALPAGAANAKTATCSTSSLAAGSHSIVASFSGDAVNISSVSSTLSQSVITDQAPTISSVTPLRTQIALGGTANFTVVASDPDAVDSVTVQLWRGGTLLATGVATGTPNTFALAYSPAAAVANDMLTVKVTDTHGVSTQQDVTLTVIAAPASATPNADAIIPGSFATPAVGTIAGSFAVSDSGAAGYTIPIQVPPGTAGMQPNLALTYSSQGGNGLLGVGWSLTGLSAITRCPKTVAQDGTRVGIDYDIDATNDNFCLDGQRLVRTAGPISVSDANYSGSMPATANKYEYRTELDTYARIEGYEDASASAVIGHYRFRVWTKSGQVFDYGSRWWIISRGWNQHAGINGSQVARANAAKVWVLDRVADRSGNFMEIDYTDRAADGMSVLHLPQNCGQSILTLSMSQPIGAYPGVEYWPTVIRYYPSDASRSECGSSASNQVRFTYEDVPSQTNIATRDRYYDSGAGQTSLSKRLIRIDTSVDGVWPAVGTPAKSYKLSYRDAAEINDLPSQQTGRSLLQRVTECGADGVCLPATQFEWAQKDWNATGHSFVGPELNLPIVFSAGSAYVADWNGDGLSDLIGWSVEDAPDGSTVRNLIVCLATTTPAPGFNCGFRPLISVGSGQQPISPEFMDMNGDGRADLVYRTVGGQWHVCLSDGNFGCTPAGGVWPISSFTGPNWRGDMDGDGTIDIITYLGNGVFQTCLTNNPSTGGSTCYTQDLSPGAYPYAPCGAYAGDPTSGCESFSDPNVQYQVLVADVNGDGRADLIRRRTDSDTEHQWKVCLSDFGVGRSNTYQCHDRWVLSSTGRVDNTTTYDFNGDGLADMASTQGQQNGVTTTWTVCLSTGDGAFEFTDPNVHWDPQQQLYVDSNGVPVNYYTSSRCRPWTGTGQTTDTKVIYGDFNGDGRTDLASWDSSTNTWRVCLSTGSDFSCSNWPGPILQGTNPDINGQVLTGDFNGDGKTDIVLLRANATAQLTLSTGPQTGDVLTKITTGLGATTQIMYAPLTDASVYAKGSGADAAFKEVDIRSPMYVVKQTQASNGIAGLFTSAYFYEGLRGRTDGRGLYGFAKKRMRDDSGVVTEHENFFVIGSLYPTYWPIVGRPRYVRKYASTAAPGSPPYLADITQSTVFNGAASLFGGNLRLVNRTTYAWIVRNSKSCGASGFTLCGGTPTVVEGLLAATLEESFELDGTALPTMTTTNVNFDEYGDPLEVTVNWSDGYVKDTVNTYAFDIGNWLLGRLTDAKNSMTKPGEAQVQRESSFTYNGIVGGACAGAVLGQLCDETIEPQFKSDVATSYSLWQKTSYQYDIYGNRAVATVKFKESDGTQKSRTTTTVFGNTGRFPIQVTNAKNQTETRQFDTRFGAMTRQQGPNGIVTNSFYDGFGRKYGERVLDAQGHSMSEVYTTIDTGGLGANERYRVVRQVSGGGQSQVFYDQLQREIRGVTKAFNNGSYATATTTYDNLGRKTGVIKPAGSGNVTTAWSLFDGLSRPTRELMTGVGQSLTSQYAYATFGSITVDGQTVGGGHVTTVKQSGTGVAQRSTSKYVNSQGQTVRVTDGAGGNTDFRFDPYGNLVKAIGPTLISEQMGYDRRGRKTSLNNPDSGAWTYQYNGAGERVLQIDAKGQSTRMFYDVLGRMIERREHPGNEGATPFVTVSSYDTYADGSACPYGIGKLCGTWTATTARSTVGGDYAAPETRTTTAFDQGGRATQGKTRVDGQTFLSITTFDANGRVDKLVYPSGFIAAHRYTAWSGQLDQVAEWVNGAPGAVHWQANARYADGQLQTMLVGNQTTSKTYDGLGRVATISTAGGAIQAASYTFDALGNLSARSDPSAGQTSQTFAYDLLNRVTSDGVSAISYDAAGNITSRAGSPYSYVGGTHRLFSGNGNSYSYDANGNVTNINGGQRTLTYTAFNLPSSITAPGGSVSYLHDASHSRLREVSSGAASSGLTYYLGGFEQHTRGDNVLEQRHYLKTPEGVIGIVTWRSNGINDARYWHEDHLGSVAVITDAAGNAKEKFSYDAWGNRNVIVHAQANGDPYDEERGYTGHEHIVEVGLTHMNGRIYDPVTGRFLQADPIVQDPFNGQSYNRYAYVLNNPLSFTDPTGFSFWTKWRKTIAAIGISVVAWYAAPYVGAYFAASEEAAIAAGASEATAADAFSASAAVGRAATVAAGGFAAGGIQGGNIQSAVAGAVFASLNYGIGGLTGHTPDFGSGPFFANVSLHAALGCAQHAAAGGSCKAGAMAGGFSAFAGPLMGGPKEAQFAAHIVMGGVASRIGGDKFANGAITASFEYLFNTAAELTRTGEMRKLSSEQNAEAVENLKTGLGGLKAGVEIGGQESVITIGKPCEGGLPAGCIDYTPSRVEKLNDSLGKYTLDQVKVVFTYSMDVVRGAVGLVQGAAATFVDSLLAALPTERFDAVKQQQQMDKVIEEMSH